MKASNIFSSIPADLPEEWTTLLCDTDGARIERIVSRGHTSPPGFWYDQKIHEWVIVLKGRATLEFEGQVEPLDMAAGDYLHIPAHTRHRVSWTDPDQDTVWLAVESRPGIDS